MEAPSSGRDSAPPARNLPVDRKAVEARAVALFPIDDFMPWIDVDKARAMLGSLTPHKAEILHAVLG